MSEVQLSGSCLCGSISYEIAGDARQFNHCHCERCRKASGTGHASNIILKPATIRWIAGESLLGSYKLPEAERFRTAFCTHCGSPMPRTFPGEVVLVPAGSLDVDPGIVPERRIYQGSRVAWSCAGDDLPGFDTYPRSR